MQSKQHVRSIDFLVVLFPLILFGIHASTVNSWIVDDAAITFAYAPNAAQGYGLVSQPFVPPVEGYSNFTWLLVMLLFNALEMFHPTVTPKLISAVLVALTCLMVYFTLRPLPYGRTATLIGLSLVSLNTSYVMWSISGLENPLYVFLITVLVFIASHLDTNKEALLYKSIFFAGVAASLAAMTRPDGLAYAVAFAPLIFLLSPSFMTIRRRFVALSLYSLTVASLYGAFLLFRLAYFGELMPNTYTMKGGPGLEDVIALITLDHDMTIKLEALLKSVADGWVIFVVFGIILGTIFSIVLQQFTRTQFVLLIVGLCSLCVYLLLPNDWMAEFRFATAFFLLFYLYAVVTTAAIVRGLPSLISQPVLIGAGLATFVFGLTLFIPRSNAFAASPTISMDSVTRRYGVRFEVYADWFDAEKASVLMPDVGGMLYYSGLRVYDMAWLTDRTVAQTLGTHINRAAFHDYVFDEIQPTFIHMHGFWSAHAKLAQDERFAANYIAICDYPDPLYRKYRSGDYVRRDVIGNRGDVLRRLQGHLDERCNLVDADRGYTTMITKKDE
jgi:hypothetical protein